MTELAAQRNPIAPRVETIAIFRKDISRGIAISGV
jgi:hypothetical protein